MKLNLDYYNSELDQKNVSDELVNIIKNNEPKNYEKTIKNEKHINNLMALSSMRENILEWYSFDEQEELLEMNANYGELTSMFCEKTSKVTAIESSKICAELIIKRNEGRENLEVIAGDISNIKLEKKFKYIVIIGIVTEISQYLTFAKEHLKENGRIFVAVNNKFGMKAWASCDENQKITRNDNVSLTKTKINELVEKFNFKYSKFYYPLPDYKFTNVIFTERYLPDLENISRNLVYQDSNLYNFKEFEGFIKVLEDNNKNFELFANSFLVEIALEEQEDNEVKFVSYTNLRKEKYRIKTILTNKEVYKMNRNNESEKHFKRIKKNINKLEELGFNTLDTFDKTKIISRYAKENSMSLDKVFLNILINDGQVAFLNKIKEYQNMLTNKLIVTDEIDNNVFDNYEIEYKPEDLKGLTFVQNGFWDLIFQNCFYENNEYFFYDQEWFDEKVPVEYIIYRAILYYREVQNFMTTDQILEKMEISKYVILFRKLDDKIQEEIRKQRMWDLFNNIKIESEEYKKLLEQNYINENIINELTQKVKFGKSSYEKEKKELELQLIHTQNIIQSIVNSRTWKWTEPLRKLKRLREANAMKNTINQIKFYFKTYGLKETVKKCLKVALRGKNNLNDQRNNYQLWIAANEPNEEELETQRKTKFKIKPKISLIVPLFNTPVNFFEELVDCLISQTYTNWELCLADGSDESNPKILEIIKKDKRIKYKFIGENKNIAGNTNEAIEMATGDYIGLLDHDDMLPIFSLFEVVKAINENPDVDFIYSDEDKIEGPITNRFDPYFKPDFSQDTLRSNNYITHFSVFRKEIMDELGGERSKYDGAQDFDLILRMSEIAKNIVHIPKVLYHWRVHKDSTARVPDAKPYAYEAGRKALADHIERVGLKGKVDFGETPGVYKVQYDVIGNPKVSIMIPNKDAIDTLKVCINSILKLTTYDNFEIVIIENNSTEKETFEYYKKIQKDSRIKVVFYPEKIFNYSGIINYGVKNAEGEFVVQLNNDTELCTPDWLEKFIGFAQREDVGAIGGRLYYPDGSIQHAGIVVGICGLAANMLTNLPKGHHGYFAKEGLTQNMSAITGACLFSKKSVYEEVGYMDEENFVVAFNDVDFCLKIREIGKKVIYYPFVEFIHYESKTRGYENTPEKQERFQNECNRFKTKWKEVIAKGDPYYNVNFSDNTANYEIKGYKVDIK